jgi:hypothetical protein
MRALLRWWPALLVTTIVIVAGTGRFRADEQTQQKEGKGPGAKEILSTVRKVIKQGALLYNARDHAGCYRYFEGSLTAMRPLLARYPDLQKAVDSSLTAAEKNPSMSERGWILYRSLNRVYGNLNSKKSAAGAKKADKASADKKTKDKKGKGSKKKDAKKKKKKGKDKKKDAQKGKDKADDKPAKDKKKSQDFDPQPPKDSADDKSEKDKQGEDKDVPKDLLKDVKKADKPAEDKKPEGKKKAKGNTKITGIVTVNGKPLTAGIITFHAPNGKKVSGKIAKDGSYTVPAIPAGEYKITVNKAKPAKPAKHLTKDKKVADKGGEGINQKTVTIPQRYADPDKSPLRVLIQEGNNNFDLLLN